MSPPHHLFRPSHGVTPGHGLTRAAHNRTKPAQEATAAAIMCGP